MLLHGKARQPVKGINRHELKLPFSCKSELTLRTFAANHLPLSMLGSRLWWSPLLMQSLPRSTSSSRFPLLFSHRFIWSTVYSSASLSDWEPGFNVIFGENRGGFKRILPAHPLFFLQLLQNWNSFVSRRRESCCNVITATFILSMRGMYASR